MIGISQLWNQHQRILFPQFEGAPSETTEGHRRLIFILDNLSIFINTILAVMPYCRYGRRKLDRFPFVSAFIAMKVLKILTVKGFLERLEVDATLRRICQFTLSEIPCEATFSNVFKEFAETQLAEKLHAELIKNSLSEDLIHHVSRDSTAIEARETPAKKGKSAAVVETPSTPASLLPESQNIAQNEEKMITTPKRSRGRPPKGSVVPPKQPSKLEQQTKMTLMEMIHSLITNCDFGCKKNSKGSTESWQGYKLHIDTIDGDIPVSAILTAASVHDSQVAIPLETMTAQRITSMYSLMDAAYDSQHIKDYISSQGKVAIIDHNQRRGEKIPMEDDRAERYKARSASERINSHLKDNYGARGLRLRGAAKIMTSLSFALVAIATEQILKLNC